MRLVICLVVAMCMIGCVTVPSALDADGNVDSELILLAEAAEKHNRTVMWWALAAAVVAIALAANSSGSDAEPEKLKCFFVIGPNGSDQFCN